MIRSAELVPLTAVSVVPLSDQERFDLIFGVAIGVHGDTVAALASKNPCDFLFAWKFFVQI